MNLLNFSKRDKLPNYMSKTNDSENDAYGVMRANSLYYGWSWLGSQYLCITILITNIYYVGKLLMMAFCLILRLIQLFLGGLMSAVG